MAAISTPSSSSRLMGLNGAFVTGDLFNLFVFFEVLLIASYVLMVHGQGGQRFKVGLHYVVLNLLASALFLIGVSLLYARTGTLNFADLALRVPMVQGPDAMVVQAAGLVLLVVFGFKAALAPLSMWLPATYAAAAAPVAALFAIMTKVGVYAILRVHGVVFGPGRETPRWRPSRCCCRWPWPPACWACWAPWQPTRWNVWWPGSRWPRWAPSWWASACSAAPAGGIALLPGPQHAGGRRAVSVVRTGGFAAR